MTSAEHVLVTGASGFIGRHVVEQLRGHASTEVVVIDHGWSGPDELHELLAGKLIERCLHLGWYANPLDYHTARAANLVSLQRSIELLDALEAHGCRHLLVAGTCAEYAPQDRPLTEEDPIGPWSVYGATKAALHLLLGSSWRPDGMRVAWARLFSLSGPGDRPERLLPMVTRSLLERRAVALTPGEQVRDYLDVADVAVALVALSIGLVDRTVNVCSGEGTTLRSLLSRVGRRLDCPELLRFGDRGYDPHDAVMMVGRNDRLRALTGWQPAHSLDDMIERVVNDAQAHELPREEDP